MSGHLYIICESQDFFGMDISGGVFAAILFFSALHEYIIGWSKRSDFESEIGSVKSSGSLPEIG